MTATAEKVADTGPEQVIAGLMTRARAAMEAFADADQAQVDEAVTALAWSIYEPTRAEELARIAVEDTGLGNVKSKIIKNQRKTFGCLRDLMRVKTVGVIEENKAKGLIKYAKPVGVVGAVSPSTNPAATPVNKAMFAIKGKNAVIVAPSPAGMKTTTMTVDYMRAELKKVGAPEDLVQVLPAPVDKALTQALMKAVDLVVITGSQNNVRRGYSSGTPCIGVGAGNVPVIIDDTADFKDAAEKIRMSKMFGGRKGESQRHPVAGWASEPPRHRQGPGHLRQGSGPAGRGGEGRFLHRRGTGGKRRQGTSVLGRKAVAGPHRLPRARFQGGQGAGAEDSRLRRHGPFRRHSYQDPGTCG